MKLMQPDAGAPRRRIEPHRDRDQPKTDKPSPRRCSHCVWPPMQSMGIKTIAPEDYSAKPVRFPIKCCRGCWMFQNVKWMVLIRFCLERKKRAAAHARQQL